MFNGRYAPAALAALIIALAAPAIASDRDGQPDSHTFELDVSSMLGKTVVMHSWDTIRFLNTGTADVTATFLAGGEPVSDPANLTPTRERGTYWDGTEVITSGTIAPGANYWVTIIEYGTFQIYDNFRPELRATIITTPETKHIPKETEGKPLDDAQIAADPVLVELVKAAK